MENSKILIEINAEELTKMIKEPARAVYRRNIKGCNKTKHKERIRRKDGREI